MNEFERDMKKVRKMEKVNNKMKNKIYRGAITPSEGVKKGDIWYMVQANKKEIIPHTYNGEKWEPIPKTQKVTVGIDTNLHGMYEYGTISNPKHYNQGKYEVIDVIEDWGLNFNLGNAIKYIARCNHKGNKIKDLQKAIWYLQREITNKGE